MVMKNNVRLNLTNNEKMAREIVGKESNATHFNASDNIESLIEKEKATKFNELVNEKLEKMSKQEELLKEYKESLKDTINKSEIKPMMQRILVRPFKANPFQQIKISEGGIITDTGDLTPESFSNDTGRWEELEREILVGAVYDVGPCCKYLKEGDVVYFSKSSMIPVPFFKQDLYTVGEQQVIAVVNEGLTERFKNDGRE